MEFHEGELLTRGACTTFKKHEEQAIWRVWASSCSILILCSSLLKRSNLLLAHGAETATSNSHSIESALIIAFKSWGLPAMTHGLVSNHLRVESRPVCKRKLLFFYKRCKFSRCWFNNNYYATRPNINTKENKKKKTYLMTDTVSILSKSYYGHSYYCLFWGGVSEQLNNCNRCLYLSGTLPKKP